jgi:transposase
MARTRPWEVSDEFWERVRLMIPPAPSHAKGGRPRLSDQAAFEAIVYVLRTGYLLAFSHPALPPLSITIAAFRGVMNRYILDKHGIEKLQ